MKKIFAVALIFVVSIFLAVIVYLPRDPVPETIDQKTEVSSSTSAFGHTYTSSEYGVRFMYPEGYYLYERAAGTPSHPQHAIVLVEDTKENRDLLNGVTTEPREGPIFVGLDIYENPVGLSPRAWAEQDTNWNIGTKETNRVTIGGTEGVSYRWDGLYAGESFIVTSDSRAYVFSVTWMDANDDIVKVFEELLDSVVFTD